MSDFLPKEYQVPSSSDGYMKLEQGENRFRILTSPIIGWEAWTPERKPVRTPMDKPFSTLQFDPSEVKHFWAMVVFNYSSKKIQILEVTQKGIQKSLRALAQDEDWGTPVNSYDLVISRTGEGMETKYETFPKPAKKTDEGILVAFGDMNINLQALYEGKDPFSEQGKPIEDEVAQGLQA